LRGVADPYCVIAPEYHWERDVPYGEFIRALGTSAAAAGQIQRVELRDLDDTGRPRRVALIGDRSTAELKATVFRSVLGTSRVRSSLIQNVTIQRSADVPTTVTIAGAGRGHGVGLCQWGARALAAQGEDAMRILQFYFPQTTIGRA
jgi:stage II sporulation protein D